MLDSVSVSSEKNLVVDTPQADNSNVPAERSNSDYVAAVRSGANTADQYLPPAWLDPGVTEDRTIDVDGMTRNYSVYVPESWDGETPLPVMYYFNGVNPNYPRDTFTGLSEEAEAKGFMLVDIVGAGAMHTFNNGQGLFDNGADENKFLNAVHDQLQTEFPLDETRQGLVGFSQGGSEAHKLAAENDWVSSTASVEGYMTGKEQPLDRPISSIIINANADDIIPIGGTQSITDAAKWNLLRSASNPLAWVLPVGQSAFEGASATPAKTGDGFLNDLWSKVTALSTGAAGGAASEMANLTVSPILQNFGTFDGTDNYVQPQSYAVQNYVQSIQPDTPVSIESANGDTSQIYRNTTTGAEVKAIQLGSGTHGWAGSTVDAENIPGMGQPNQSVDASDQISDFFMAHPLGH